jgi:protein-disulfide isomerase
LLAGAILTAVVGAAAVITLGLATQGQGGIGRLDGISASGRTLGDASAPVKVLEFADYQCPHCKQFEQGTSQQLQEDYIAKGLVQLEFRNHPIIGNESVLAAESALCAGDQGKFWEYHDALFDAQRGENSGNFSPDRLVGFAQDLGLDLDEFTQCMNDRAYKGVVEDEAAAAREEGAEGTPFFVVSAADGRSKTVGSLRSYEELSSAIDEMLASPASKS